MMQDIMNSYESTGTINEIILQEIKIHLIPKKQRVGLYIFMTVFVCFAIISLINRQYTMVIVWIFSVIMLAIEFFVIGNKCLKVNLKRMEELYGVKECKYTNICDEEGIHINNHLSNASGNIKFTSIVKLVKSPSTYTIFTEADQYIVFFRNSFNAGLEEQFVDFIKRKNKRVKLK